MKATASGAAVAPHTARLWSISRGLARGLSGQGEHERMLDLTDTPRRGDVDGRGNLSLQALEQFVEWFLKVTRRVAERQGQTAAALRRRLSRCAVSAVVPGGMTPMPRASAHA